MRRITGQTKSELQLSVCSSLQGQNVEFLRPGSYHSSEDSGGGSSLHNTDQLLGGVEPNCATPPVINFSATNIPAHPQSTTGGYQEHQEVKSNRVAVAMGKMGLKRSQSNQGLLTSWLAEAYRAKDDTFIHTRTLDGTAISGRDSA